MRAVCSPSMLVACSTDDAGARERGRGCGGGDDGGEGKRMNLGGESADRRYGSDVIVSLSLSLSCVRTFTACLSSSPRYFIYPLPPVCPLVPFLVSCYRCSSSRLLSSIICCLFSSQEQQVRRASLHLHDARSKGGYDDILAFNCFYLIRYLNVWPLPLVDRA